MNLQEKARFAYLDQHATAAEDLRCRGLDYAESILGGFCAEVTKVEPDGNLQVLHFEVDGLRFKVTCAIKECQSGDRDSNKGLKWDEETWRLYIVRVGPTGTETASEFHTLAELGQKLKLEPLPAVPDVEPEEA